MRQILPAILFVSFLANVFLVIYLFDRSPSETAAPQTDAVEQTTPPLPYLSKRIFAPEKNDTLINFVPLRNELRQYIETIGESIGLYFEYLPSGVSIGVNDREEVKIVSLAKVPLVMAIFKKIERGGLTLHKTIRIEKRHLNQEFGTLYTRGEGTSLTIEELIRYCLTESDNTAFNALAEQLTEDEMGEVYTGLDIPLGVEEEEEEGQIHILVSPKNYSSIYRSLYLASFLSEEHSNTILTLLTQTVFKDKLVAGVPTTVPVAHKVGVYNPSGTTENLFIDCGVVYAPDRPYTLCIFVQGSEDEAKGHMAQLSKLIYEYVSQVKVEKHEPGV